MYIYGSRQTGLADRLQEPLILKPSQRYDYPATQGSLGLALADGFGQIRVHASELQEKVTKLYELAGNLQEAGKTLAGKGGKDLGIAASNLLAAAESLTNAAGVYNDFTKHLSRLPLEEASKVTEKGKNIVDALNLVSALADNKALKEFINNPTLENAQRWSEDAADTFAKAAKVVEMIPDLPFISPMLKGYLSAPANYVRAFNKIIWLRVNKIDAVAGIAPGASCTVGEKAVWRGELARMYCAAGHELQMFMQKHRKSGGFDLYNVSKELGLAHLMLMAQRDLPEDSKYRMLAWLGRWL